MSNVSDAPANFLPVTPAGTLGGMPTDGSRLNSLPLQQPQTSVPVAKVNKLFIAMFVILGMTCLWNLNGITAIMFEMNRLMSIVILLSGLYLIFAAYASWSRGLGVAGWSFVLFLLTYLAIGFAVKQDVSMLISYLNSVFVIFAGAMVSYHFAQRGQTNKLLIILCVLAALGAYTIYLSPFLGDYYAQMQKLDRMARQGRWMGFFANPNDTGMAAVLAFVCSLSVWLISVKGIRFKKYLPPIVGFLALAAVLSFSRSAMVTFALLGVFVMVYSAGLGRRAIGTLMAGMFVFAMTYWFFTSGYKQYEWSVHQEKRIQSVERLLTYGELSHKDTGGRLEGIRGGLHYWSKSPIFGHGLGSLHRMPFHYFGGLGCHNSHVMVLGEVGIVGFAVYLLALVVYLISSFKIRYLPVRMFSILFFWNLMANGMVSHSVYSDRNFNLVMGIVFGLQAYYLAFEERQRLMAQFRERQAKLQRLSAEFAGMPIHTS